VEVVARKKPKQRLMMVGRLFRPKSRVTERPQNKKKEDFPKLSNQKANNTALSHFPYKLK
jgi:hypothetical protein